MLLLLPLGFRSGPEPLGPELVAEGPVERQRCNPPPPLRAPIFVPQSRDYDGTGRRGLHGFVAGKLTVEEGLPLESLLDWVKV